MKELVTKLMNHGFSEHQAQMFLRECYNEFAKLVNKRLEEKLKEDPSTIERLVLNGKD